jgi:two-component system, OmpR family, sensor histidine kinase KdpD
VPGETVVAGIQSVLRDLRATQLVLGKSNRSRWFELRHGSVVDRLVRDTPDVTVHVLPMPMPTSPSPSRRQRGPKRPGQRGTPAGYAITTAMVAAVTGSGEKMVKIVRSHDCHPRYCPSLPLRWPQDQRSH